MNELYLAAPVAITGLVGWLRFRPRAPAVVAPVVESSPEPVRLDDMTKVDRNVDRFTLAIEQCTNPAMLPEYQKNLAYWQALKSAVDMKPEA